jgi:acid phosphatase
MENTDQLVFFTLGDWGSPGQEVLQLAKAMDTYAKVAKPDFILAVGDNFYPCGIFG